MVLGGNAYDPPCYGYELFRWFLGLHSWFLDQICGWCLHGDFRKDKKKYIAWIHLHVVITICIKIIYCRIVLGTYMDEDCWLNTWMIIQSCINGDMLMIRSYLYNDRLFRTYVDWCRYSQLMILGPCRSGWLWCFSHMIEWFYILCKRMS